MAKVLAWVIGLAAVMAAQGPPRSAALAAGKVLVASRAIADHHFSQTVILIAIYDDRGAFGLALNVPSEVPVAQIFPGIKPAQRRADVIFLGGPVEPSQVFGLTRGTKPAPGAIPVLGKVLLISDRQQLEAALTAKVAPAELHLYAGYTGWSKAQLMREVDAGEWFIVPAEASMIFSTAPSLLWPGLIARADPKAGRGAAELFF